MTQMCDNCHIREAEFIGLGGSDEKGWDFALCSDCQALVRKPTEDEKEAAKREHDELVAKLQTVSKEDLERRIRAMVGLKPL